MQSSYTEITKLLGNIKNNEEIYSYGDSFVLHPITTKLIKINARKYINTDHLGKTNMCSECKGKGIDMGKSIHKIIHQVNCSKLVNIVKLKEFLSTEPSDNITPIVFNALPEATSDFFTDNEVDKKETSFILYKKDYKKQYLGKFIKMVDPNNSHHEERPVLLYFSNLTEPISYEYFSDKGNMKFVEVI
jgi:hypothetical protein